MSKPEDTARESRSRRVFARVLWVVGLCVVIVAAAATPAALSFGLGIGWWAVPISALVGTLIPAYFVLTQRRVWGVSAPGDRVKPADASRPHT